MTTHYPLTHMYHQRFRKLWPTLLKSRPYADTSPRKHVPYSLLMLCMSHLDYLNAVLYGIPNKILNKYQRIQNMCAKLALGKSKYDSSTECLKTLHWLPIRQQIEFKSLVLTHMCINNSAPGYLQDLILVKVQNRVNMRSRSMGVLLNIPKVKQTTFAARSFRYIALRLWNSLPTDIRCTTNLDKFKALLKTNLF